jgi:catechol 2,3-dioxygenase-like lactoylglutathione lyase family enzyme
MDAGDHEISSRTDWPDHLPVAAVRFARPTADLDAAVRFYRDDLGLRQLAEFHDHDGYDGFVLGLPGSPVHLEITARAGELPANVSSEHQLVLYFDGADAMRAPAERLIARGHPPVVADNPYWERRDCVAFRDPDGWLVILAPFVFAAE